MKKLLVIFIVLTISAVVIGANISSPGPAIVDSGDPIQELFARRVLAEERVASVQEQSLGLWPPTTVDDSNAVRLGGWMSGATTYSGYVGAGYSTDGNASKGLRTVVYSPNLPAWTYRVYMNVPVGLTSLASNVPIDIYTSSGTTTMNVNEQVPGWTYLGTFSLAPNSKVVIRTDGTTLTVAADAFYFAR